MSRSSFDEVMITTGVDCVRGSALIRRSTSIPSTRGSLRSSSTILGPLWILRFAYRSVQNMNSSASAPSRTTCTQLAIWCVLNACSASFTSLGLSSTSRISTPLSVIVSPFLESEIKRGTFVGFGLGPDAAAVTMHDPLDDGQPDARPVVIFEPVKTLEDAE